MSPGRAGHVCSDGKLAWVRTFGATHPNAALMVDGGVVLVGLISGTTAVLEGGAS
jgi:hypothetical protein